MARSRDEAPAAWGQAMWQVQPRWLRILAVVVMFPSWLVMAALLLGGQTDGRAFMVALTVFAAIGGMELIYVAKAYWKHEI